MRIGRVKHYDPRKGLGFIKVEDGPDVFVRYAAIETHGQRTLDRGETVQFESIDTPTGRRATRVRRWSTWGSTRSSSTAVPTAPSPRCGRDAGGRCSSPP